MLICFSKVGSSRRRDIWCAEVLCLGKDFCSENFLGKVEGKNKIDAFFFNENLDFFSVNQSMRDVWFLICLMCSDYNSLLWCNFTVLHGLIAPYFTNKLLECFPSFEGYYVFLCRWEEPQYKQIPGILSSEKPEIRVILNRWSVLQCIADLKHSCCGCQLWRTRLLS